MAAEAGERGRIPPMDPDDLLQRARERHAEHLPGKGVCRDCVLEEMEDMLLEENPEMPRGDAHDLVREWVRQAGHTAR